MKTILTYGTFDLFHVGHVHILRRARALGDRLIVGISSDEFNATKGKKSFMSFDDRCTIVASSRYVDDVFAEVSWDQKINDIQRFNADVFVMGDDWAGKFDDLSQFCDVQYLSRTEGVSSSFIRKSLGGDFK